MSEGLAYKSAAGIAMIACAALAATGAVIAWLMIGADALEAEPKRRGRLAEVVPADFACSVAGPPLRSATKHASTVEPGRAATAAARIRR